MNEKDDILLRNKMKEMIRLKIKPNFAAFGLFLSNISIFLGKLRLTKRLKNIDKFLLKQIKSLINKDF